VDGFCLAMRISLQETEFTSHSGVVPQTLIVPPLVKKFLIITEPEGSLPHSQKPTTCLCLQSNESPPCCHTLSLRFILIYYNLCLVLQQVVSFPSGFLTRTLNHFSSFPQVAHAPTHLIICIENLNIRQ
jgi:hypothetical protein